MPDVLAYLHDGALFSVDLEEEAKAVVIHCRSYDGRLARIRLTGVADLSIQNLRLGNIILFVKVFDTIEELGAEMLAALAQTNDEAMVQRYVEWTRTLTNPRFLLLLSSYGADAACVFTGEVAAEFVVTKAS